MIKKQINSLIQTNIFLQLVLSQDFVDMRNKLLTLFHFNDAYNIQPGSIEPKGGAAFFNSLLQREKKKYQHTLTLFSGDAFSPSLLSTELQGENMIKPLQSFGIDIACYGNHDFDLQLQKVKELTKKTGFPWLLSNLYDRRTKRRLAEGLQSQIFLRNGLKIGVFSLVEQEWKDILYAGYKQIVQYIPFINFAQKMVVKLKEQEQCDFVIALTHMMKYNDVNLAKAVKGIDLILGGHDHLILHQKINESLLVKSGSDFQHFSVIKIQKNEEQKYTETAQDKKSTVIKTQKWIFQIQLFQVNHTLLNLQPDPELNLYIDQIYKEFRTKQQKVACFTKKDIDLRFNTIRKQQSPYLQFLVSLYRHESGADIAMMNSGGFRSDAYIKAGPITFGVIENMILDRVIVKIVPAKILIQTLEISVSMYPNLSGRYFAFSGISFTWDASKKPGARIIISTIKIHDEIIGLNKSYRVALHSFVGKGGDGYDCLKDCEQIVSDGDKYNRQLIHDLLNINHYLLDSYMVKYPNRFKIIEYEGRHCLELDLPEPKNVNMIMSTGQIYQSH